MQQAAPRLVAPESATVPVARPTGLRWRIRDIAATSARARGVSESAIRSMCEVYAEEKYATRKAVWWADRFDDERNREAWLAAFAKEGQ